jgi:predicted nucleotidyltransferase
MSFLRAAFVYGSVAKGADHAASDVDVLVIADDLTYSELLATLEPAETQLGRKVKAPIGRPGENPFAG